MRKQREVHFPDVFGKPWEMLNVSVSGRVRSWDTNAFAAYNAVKCNHLRGKKKNKLGGGEEGRKPGHEVLFQKHITNKKEFNPFLPAATSSLAYKHPYICFGKLGNSHSKHQQVKVWNK